MKRRKSGMSVKKLAQLNGDLTYQGKTCFKCLGSERKTKTGDCVNGCASGSSESLGQIKADRMQPLFNMAMAAFRVGKGA